MWQHVQSQNLRLTLTLCLCSASHYLENGLDFFLVFRDGAHAGPEMCVWHMGSLTFPYCLQEWWFQVSEGQKADGHLLQTGARRVEQGDGQDHRGLRLQGRHKNTSGQGCLTCPLIILAVCASGPFKLHAFSTCNCLFYIPIKLP